MANPAPPPPPPGHGASLPLLPSRLASPPLPPASPDHRLRLDGPHHRHLRTARPPPPPPPPSSALAPPFPRAAATAATNQGTGYAARCRPSRRHRQPRPRCCRRRWLRCCRMCCPVRRRLLVGQRQKRGTALALWRSAVSDSNGGSAPSLNVKLKWKVCRTGHTSVLRATNVVPVQCAPIREEAVTAPRNCSG